MRQTIHILKKDIRHLWIEIALVLLTAGLFAFIHTNENYWRTRAETPQTVAAFIVSLLLPVSWWLLIVRAVHDENLVGDREFWPTRPYSWKSLLAAKLLFIGLFLNLPMLAAQVVILRAHGFGVVEQAAALLWNQALLTAVFFLPVAAISALTSGMAQFLMIGLAAWAGLLLLSLRFTVFAGSMGGSGWGPLDWVRVNYAFFLAGLAASMILLWQYARRRTMAARLAGVAALLVIGCGAPFSWAHAFSLQTRFSRQPAAGASIRAGLNTDFQWMIRTLIRTSGRDPGVQLNIPLRFSGVPENLVPKPEGLTFSIEAPGGAVWRAGGAPPSQFTAAGRLVSLRAPIDESFYRQVKDQEVAVRGTVYVTLYGNVRETRVPFTGRTQDVPGMGRCAATGGPPAPYFLSCFSAMRPRAERVAVWFERRSEAPERRLRVAASYSPFPAELALDPLMPTQDYSTFAGRLDAVTVSSEEPVAYVRVPLAIDGLRLGAYEANLNK